MISALLRPATSAARSHHHVVVNDAIAIVPFRNRDLTDLKEQLADIWLVRTRHAGDVSHLSRKRCTVLLTIWETAAGAALEKVADSADRQLRPNCPHIGRARFGLMRESQHPTQIFSF